MTISRKKCYVLLTYYASELGSIVSFPYFNVYAPVYIQYCCKYTSLETSVMLYSLTLYTASTLYIIVKCAISIFARNVCQRCCIIILKMTLLLTHHHLSHLKKIFHNKIFEHIKLRLMYVDWYNVVFDWRERNNYNVIDPST